MPIDHTHFRWKVERSLASDFARGDHFQSTQIAMSCHAFTHMDAPRHFVPDGHTTDGITLDKVVGEAAVVDLVDIEPNEEITPARLEGPASHVPEGGIALLKTAWDRQRSPSTPEFWLDAPFMTRESSQFMLDKGIRAIALAAILAISARDGALPKFLVMTGR